MSNLWGNLTVLPPMRTPVSILKEQAGYLTDATNGILQGEVDSVPNVFYDKTKFRYDLSIVVPTLNHYKYTILRISHDIKLFPVELELQDETFECPDEDSYLAALKGILSSDETRRVLATLLAQANS